MPASPRELPGVPVTPNDPVRPTLLRLLAAVAGGAGGWAFLHSSWSERFLVLAGGLGVPYGVGRALGPPPTRALLTALQQQLGLTDQPGTGLGRTVAREVQVQVLGLSMTLSPGDEADRQLLWTLWVELSTRIATVELPDDQGTLRAALDSLYTLHGRVRQALLDAGPDLATGPGTAEALALQLLNGPLRTFLATWHPRLDAHEAEHGTGPASEAAWPEADAFRGELEGLRTGLSTLRDQLGGLLGRRP